jgi:PAS domain-containing protein
MSLASLADPSQSQSNVRMLDPDEWNAWIGLGSAVAAIFMWVWRHSLGAFCVWMWNFIQAPKLIRDQNLEMTKLFKEIREVKAHAEYAVVTSRISWSFIERPVLQFDSLGNCVFANDFAERLLARQQGEFLGSGWLSLVHTDDSERIERTWKTCVADKRNFFHVFRIISSSGVEVRVQDRAEIMYDRLDNVLGWYHLMTVIHD